MGKLICVSGDEPDPEEGARRQDEDDNATQDDQDDGSDPRGKDTTKATGDVRVASDETTPPPTTTPAQGHDGGSADGNGGGSDGAGDGAGAGAESECDEQEQEDWRVIFGLTAQESELPPLDMSDSAFTRFQDGADANDSAFTFSQDARDLIAGYDGGAHDPRYHSGLLGPLVSGPLTPLSRPLRDIDRLTARAWQATQPTQPPPPPETPTPDDIAGIDQTWLRGVLPPLPPGVADETRMEDSADGGAFPPPIPPLPSSPHLPPLGATEAAWQAWQSSPQGRAWHRAFGAFATPPSAPATPSPSARPMPFAPRAPRQPPDLVPVYAGSGGPSSGGGRGSGSDGTDGSGGSGGRGQMPNGPLGRRLQQAPIPTPRGWSQVGPGGPGGYFAQRAIQEEAAMAVLIERSRPYRPQEEPPNVTAATQYVRIEGQRRAGLTLMLADDLPANTLGELRLSLRAIRLSSRLFPAPSTRAALKHALCQPASLGEWGWDHLIEDNHSARFVLASLFTAWYCYTQNVAAALHLAPEQIALGHHRRNTAWATIWNPLHPLVVAFAPVATFSKTWNAGWQNPYYTSHWTHLLSLLVNQTQLDAQARVYLDLDEDQPAPRRQQLLAALKRVSAPYATDEIRRRYRSLDEFAWSQYIEFLAGESHVPAALVRAKVCGERATIRSGEEMARLTTDLIAGDGHLCALRRRVAEEGYWVQARKARDGSRVAPEEQVALYLAEPLQLIPAMTAHNPYFN
jgi:hypothetical protein